MHEYDLIAEWYATDRDHGTGIPEVTALSDSLPGGATVLDVGCGTGIPITRALVAAGHSVLGVVGCHLSPHARRSDPGF